MQPAPAYNIDKAKFSLLANSRWVQAARVGDVHCGAIPLHQREHSPGDKRGEEHYFQVMGGERRGGAIIVFYPLLFRRSCPSTTGIGRRKNVSPSDFAAMEGFSNVDDLNSSEAEAEGIGPLLMIIDMIITDHCFWSRLSMIIINN